MGLSLFIDGLVAAGLLIIWYVCFARYNRRKGAAAMRWLQVACLGQGRISEAQWHGPSRVHARLAFAAHWIDTARVTIRLCPRPVPLQWLWSAWRKQKETLTFEADLDCAPGFCLQVYRHRWLTHKHINVGSDSKRWTVSRPGPVVLTTRSQWTQELTPVVNTLMTSRGHNLISVRLRPASPHLTATIALEALSGEEGATSFLSVVRELAAGASTSRQD